MTIYDRRDGIDEEVQFVSMPGYVSVSSSRAEVRVSAEDLIWELQQMHLPGLFISYVTEEEFPVEQETNVEGLRREAAAWDLNALVQHPMSALDTIKRLSEAVEAEHDAKLTISGLYRGMVKWSKKRIQELSDELDRVSGLDWAATEIQRLEYVVALTEIQKILAEVNLPNPKE